MGLIKGGAHLIKLGEAVALCGVLGIVSPGILTVISPQDATRVRQRGHSWGVSIPLQSSRCWRCRGIEFRYL